MIRGRDSPRPRSRITHHAITPHFPLAERLNQVRTSSSTSAAVGLTSVWAISVRTIRQSAGAAIHCHRHGPLGSYFNGRPRRVLAHVGPSVERPFQVARRGRACGGDILLAQLRGPAGAKSAPTALKTSCRRHIPRRLQTPERALSVAVRPGDPMAVPHRVWRHAARFPFVGQKNLEAVSRKGRNLPFCQWPRRGKFLPTSRKKNSWGGYFCFQVLRVRVLMPLSDGAFAGRVERFPVGLHNWASLPVRERLAAADDGGPGRGGKPNVPRSGQRRQFARFPGWCSGNHGLAFGFDFHPLRRTFQPTQFFPDSRLTANHAGSCQSIFWPPGLRNLVEPT